ncbi:unnamed protein product [Polarella glacialis]|uniref:EF-hand domain-containing protein n=1 Tax=Polarella glacialis TaxID=89957 RepID=A0A813JAV1_POLGL|nr:unnamed protein product [Polarella glacialis]
MAAPAEAEEISAGADGVIDEITAGADGVIDEINAVVDGVTDEIKHLRPSLTQVELNSIYAGADGVMDEVEKIMMKYDADQSGCFSVAEVKAIIQDLENHRKQAKHMLRALLLTIVLALIVLGTLFVMMFLSNEAAKENHTSGGTMVDLEGEAVKVATVESMSGLFDLPLIDTNTLAYMSALTFFIDMRSDAKINSELEATMKVGGAMRAPDDSNQVYVITTSGFRITIDGASTTGSIEMGNTTFPISDKSFVLDRRLQETSTQEDSWMKCDESRASCFPKAPPKGWHKRRLQERESWIRLSCYFNFLLLLVVFLFLFAVVSFILFLYFEP